MTVDLGSGFTKFDVKPRGFKPSWIVIHHSFSPDSLTTRNWDDIRKYHTSFRYAGDIITEEQYNDHLKKGETKGLEKPWLDIAYQFGVENVNGKLTILDGRKIGEIGAHAVGFNSNSIGICLIGNYDIEAPSEDRLSIMASLVRDLQRQFKIPRDQVIGHRETFVKRGVPVEKTCPGSKFVMEDFRARLIDV